MNKEELIKKNVELTKYIDDLVKQRDNESNLFNKQIIINQIDEVIRVVKHNNKYIEEILNAENSITKRG